MTTQTLACNTNNDLYLDSFGNIIVAYDLQAVLQVCQNVARSLLGEMVLNTDQGIPYFQTVWNGTPNFQQFQAALTTSLLAVPDVNSVLSLVVSQSGNTLNYTAVIQTIYGQGTING